MSGLIIRLWKFNLYHFKTARFADNESVEPNFAKTRVSHDRFAIKERGIINQSAISRVCKAVHSLYRGAFVAIYQTKERALLRRRRGRDERMVAGAKRAHD